MGHSIFRAEINSRTQKSVETVEGREQGHCTWKDLGFHLDPALSSLGGFR